MGLATSIIHDSNSANMLSSIHHYDVCSGGAHSPKFLLISYELDLAGRLANILSAN